MNCITMSQIGLILVVVGTILLAFSVKVKRQYSGKIAAEVDSMKKNSHELVEPTETTIVRPLFWLGLFFNAVGSLLQW